MEIKPRYSAAQCRRHTGNCCVKAVEVVPLRPKDVYLQNGCWHALREGAVDHSEAPFHGCVELLLASLQGQGDPSCSAEAPSELSFGWLGVHAGMNDAKGQRQAQEQQTWLHHMQRAQRDEAGRRAKQTWQLFATKTFVVTKACGKKGTRSAKTSEYEDR